MTQKHEAVDDAPPKRRTTDATSRSEFPDDIGPEIREALAVRSAYRVAREPTHRRRPT